jgi:hypothetical protein
VLEIACDESGYEGEKLIGTTTDVFAHAGVRMDTDAAAACIAELRRLIRSPATEYKANHLLREKHRAALEWTLGPTGPLPGRAHVYLIDKAYHVVRAAVGVLVGAGADPAPLYRDGPRAAGPRRWHEFLVAANELLRGRDRWDPRTSVDAFFGVLDELPPLDGAAGDLVRRLRDGRSRAESFREDLRRDPRGVPTLDPLIPAILRAVQRWWDGSGPVMIAHDRQVTLSRGRIAQLVAASDGRLAGVSFASSGTDPRIQVADIVAGVARKIASDELNGRGDDRLTALLRPYLEAFPIWGDAGSWARLGG